MKGLATLILLVYLIGSVYSENCNVADDSRFDCYPQPDASKDKCEARGCCWVPASVRPNPKSRAGLNLTNLDTPYCFYPADYRGYRVVGIKETELGFLLDLQLNSRGGPYGNNYQEIVANVAMETQTRFRLTVSICTYIQIAHSRHRQLDV